MNTCKTCAHWGHQAERTKGRRDCNAIGNVSGDYEKIDKKLMVFIHDDERKQAIVYTLADFGCVLHEPDPQPIVGF